MPKIYDNIEYQLSGGLVETLKLSQRGDFCVGYFNLRGWHEIADQIDSLTGIPITEKNARVHRCCRLLVGMQKLPLDLLRESFLRSDSYIIDQAEMLKLKKKLAYEFREQLTIGTPTERDEIYLRNDEGIRYRAIKAYLEEKESKVILLSATPYNKSYVDLSNQLRLFLAVDDIFKYPLKEFARDTLNRQLKAGIADDGLALLVASLRDDDKLCITGNEEPVNRLPQIICSLGLKNGE